VDVRRNARGLQREAKALDHAGLQSLEVDDRRDAVHKPETECVGRCEEAKAHARRRLFGAT
jgi:hypothetical protein